MTPDGPAAGGEHLRQRALGFIRTSAPFAYCDACLAVRLEASVAELAAVLADLADGSHAVLVRTRRACYGCHRTLEISALRDGPTPPPRA